MLSRQIKLSVIAFLLILPGVLPVQAQGTFDPSVCAQDNTGKPLSQACQDTIKAFPRPQVDEIPKDNQTIQAYSFWRVGPDAINLYDGPNGNVVGQIAKGFNFVRAINLDVDG